MAVARIGRVIVSPYVGLVWCGVAFREPGNIGAADLL